MQEHVEDNWEYFSWFEKVIAESLFIERFLAFLFKVLRLDVYAKIISVIFLDLNNYAYGHGLVSELHCDYFVEVRTREGYLLSNWFSSHDWTNFYQSKLFNIMVTDQNIILVATNA